MTNFKQSFRVMWRPKFRSLNQLLFFNLLAVVLTMAYEIWSHGFATLEMIGPVVFWGLLFGFTGFCWLTWHNEKMLVSDSYRLLPVGDTTLYLANLLSSLGSLVYMGLVEVVLLLVGSAMNGSAVRAWFRQTMNLHLTAHDWHQLQVYSLTFVLWAVAIVLWVWVFITLIHFATEAVSAFIPGASQRLVKTILAVLLVWAIVAFLNWVSNLADRLVQLVISTGSDNLVWNFATLTLAIVLVSWLNIYLMRRWVEARY